MMTYKFIAINNTDGDCRRIEHTFSGEKILPELVEYFNEWLKGVGFIYDGHLEMVEDNASTI